MLMMRRFSSSLVLVLGLALASSLVSAAGQPPKPVFADNYRLHGLLSLPYAELNEPFSAFYDKQLKRSRTDYFGQEYQVYQFGPNGSRDGGQYGATYQLVYVPADFNTKAKESRVHQLLDKAMDRLHLGHHGAHHQKSNPQPAGGEAHEAELNTADKPSRTPVKRVCFTAQGGVGYTVSPQSVLPNLNDFSYDSTGRCPHVAGDEHRQSKCELWKLITQVEEKKNVYKFWLKRDSQNSSMAIPVHYYMLGYDTLLGSHFDRYDISYFKYQAQGASDEDFVLTLDGNKCGPFPGPGDSKSMSDSERRARIVAQNPIHQYVVEPHRYDHVDHEFDQFKTKHEQFVKDKYQNEQQERKAWFNYLHNLRYIESHNRQMKPYKLAANRFADENVSQLKYLRGRLRSTGAYNGGQDYAGQHQTDNKQLPATFDWTAVGAVTPVKDQAVCGSCWSFGTTGTIEGAYFVKTGKLLRLSQQQLVDCSWKFGNNGCDGGEDSRAYGYVMEAGGLSTEEEYGHYKAIDGMCRDKDVGKPVKIKGFYNVTTNSVEALKHAIVTYGPVSISIDASRPTFAFYSHGAYYDEKCQNSPDNLDHAVLAVGYMELDGKLVWKVKNSWSTYWGNDGYIYMSAENNNCGVLDTPTVPIIDA